MSTKAELPKVNNLYRRKEMQKENFYAELDKNMNSITKRQHIMRTNPDLVSDQELVSHRRQIRVGKLMFLITGLGVPAALYYFAKLSCRLTVLSAVVGILVANGFWRTKMLSNNCHYSVNMAYDSIHTSIDKMLLFNNLQTANGDIFWGAKAQHQRQDKKLDSQTKY